MVASLPCFAPPAHAAAGRPRPAAPSRCPTPRPAPAPAFGPTRPAARCLTSRPAPRRDRPTLPTVAAAGDSAGGASPSPSSPPPPPPSSLLARVKAFLGRDKVDKAAMARLGLGAVASYGFVSNVTYGGGLAVSWIAFVRQKGLSPLAPGAWPTFLAFYAGFWMAQNFVRPLRLSAALAMAPLFDRFITFVEKRAGLSRGGAFGVYIGLLGVTTMTLVFGSIFLACGPAAYARA